MATTLVIANKDEGINTIMSKKFMPKLTAENDSIYFPLNYENSNTNEENVQNKLNKMSFVLPSMDREKIENFLKNNKTISIEEGIKQLKELTLSENSKKNKNKPENPRININPNEKNMKHYIYNRKFCNKIPIKRNHNSMLSQSSQNYINNNSINNNIITNSNANNIITNNNNINNTNNFINNNNNNELILRQQKIEKENAARIQREKLEKEKENQRLKERKKNELKTYDKVAQELTESRNANELKEYLFRQLVLLDNKKQEDNNKIIMENNINNTINQLNRDIIELRKCNTVVSKALNKKATQFVRLANQEKKIENEIVKTKESLNYHAYVGDLYKEQLNYFKENNF